MRNIKLTIEYEGTNYAGWQRQKNTRRTIQQTLEKILRQILQEEVILIAAGRTDAGVHAKAQVANFKTRGLISLAKLQSALNSLLPSDIKISKIQEVPLTFHSQYNAKLKTYRYTILNRSFPSAFLRNLVYFYPYPLDVNLMQKASLFLLGKFDFSSFAKTDKKNTSAVRTIKAIKIKKQGHFIYINITADGFLYNMARNIVGTLIEVGRKRIPVLEVKKILKARNRRIAGPAAPSRGLCLQRVEF